MSVLHGWVHVWVKDVLLYIETYVNDWLWICDFRIKTFNFSTSKVVASDSRGMAINILIS